MGISQSIDDFEAGGYTHPASWSLDHVKELAQVWKDVLNMNFGLKKDQVAALFSKCSFAAGKDFGPLVTECWRKFNPDNQALVDALGLICTFAIVSRADFSEKIDFVFKLFDFNGNGHISKDELTILVMASLLGMVRYFRPSKPIPSDAACESFSDRAFKEIDADAGGSIALHEFRDFVKLQLDKDGSGAISADEFLQYFGVAGEAGAREATRGRPVDPLRHDSSDDEAKGPGSEDDFYDSDIERDQPSQVAVRPNVADQDSMFEMDDGGSGDQFMAVKPWIGAIVAPSAPPKTVNARPDADLALEWVHGYRAFDTRSNVRVLANGEYVWHTAAVGIVYNKEKHEQRQFFGHNDDIVALALHPNGEIVATGQMGKRPVIHVWDASKPEGEQAIIALKAKTLTRACTQLAFSPDGKMLAAVGLDDDHTLHVFLDWAAGAEAGVAVIETDKAKILDLAFGDGGKLMTVGVDHVGVWTVSGRRIDKKKGLFGSQKIQAIVSVTYFQGKFVTGSVSGRLWSWNGAEVETVLKEAHTSSINSMYAVGDLLLSGGKDGKVVLWNKALTKSGLIDISTAPGLASTKDACVRSIACAAGGKNIVVGAMSGDILVYANPTAAPTVIHESHYYGELWGLAMHPSNDTYATAGDDATVRIWNRTTHRCVVRKSFDTYIRCLAYSPDGKFIACGTGGRLGGLIPKTNGALYILNAATLEVVHAGQDSKRWNQDVKWSPDGTTIALGCHDQVVHLYDATDGYKEKGVCRGHSSFIAHIDFTADSQFIHTTCGAYELLFWDANTGAQDPSGATNLRDAEWATWTAVLGWPVQGIWPPAADGTDVNNVDRSHSGRMLVTVDDFGKVKLFNFPNIAPGWMSAEFEGHSSHVTNCRWSHDDKHIVTVGGNDKSVFQWRVEHGVVDLEAEALDEVVDEEDEELTKIGGRGARGAAVAVAKKKVAAPVVDLFAMDDADGGDQFTAVKPWIGAIKAPSRPPKLDNTAPAIAMDLQWVYGYQAQAMRNSLRYTASGKIAYTVAAVGIVYDPAAHAQTHFRGHHTDDIISFAQSSDGKFVATGEQGKRPSVFVWNSETREVEWELKGHKRGVPQIAFSNNGKMLATVGLDDDHTIIVYDLGTGEVMCKQKGDTNQIMSIAWASNDSAFVTTGVKHICFWEPSIRGLVGKKGILGTKGKQQTHMISSFDSAGNAVVGNNDGSIYVFGTDRTLKSVVAGHTGAVYAIWFDGAHVFTGGKDNLVKKWSAGCGASEQEWTFGGAIRSIHTSRGKMLVGTIFSEIIEVTGTAQAVLAEAHYFGELWGLATHPNKDQFVSAGDDGTLRTFDAIGHRQLGKVSLATLARAACYSPDGSKIAVALGGRLGGKEEGPEGQWHVLDSATLAIEHTGNDAKAWCQDIRWSPDGRTIALGSHDDKIYLYDAAAGYALKGICKGHSSYITHIDFTADSRFIHTNCGAYELLFWDANTGAQDPSGATNLKDAEWATWTAVLGWPVQGIWPPLADGTDINAVDCSHEGTVLASADDFGKVKLFRYPVVNVGAGFSQLDGHSSHVTNVRFTHDDCYVISAGGNDRALFQWDNTANEPESIEFEDKDLENEGFVPPRTAAHEAARAGLFFEVEGDAAGDQFMAVKPWIGAIKGPTTPPVVPNDPTYADLDLEWVHGYRSFDTRSNLYYLGSGEIVYHTAAVGIVFDKKTWTQRFFKGHTDDIVSLAVHPNGTTVATGQMGKDPSIFVWDAVSLTVIKEIKGFHKRAVSTLKFSEDGDLLLSIGQDDDHSLGVYDWKAVSATRPRRGAAPPGGKFCKVHQDKVLDAAFSTDGSEICVVGVKIIKVFNANTLSGGAVAMGDIGKLQPFMSVAYFNGFAVVGTATGSLYLVKDKKVQREVAAHGSTVNTIFITSDGKMLTGAKDGDVKIWNASFEVTGTFSVAKSTKSVLPNVRSIAKHHADNQYLVGTMGSEIYELKEDGSCPAGEPFTEGHYYGELWGLATHPSSNTYVTSGDDGWVRVWNVERKRCVAKTSVGTLARAACYSPDGSKIVVCLGGRLGGKEEGPEGEWRVLDASSLAVLHKGSDTKSWCQDVKWSPDGGTIAIGSHDDKIYLFDATDGYALKGICKGHSSYITHIDFTADSKFIHTNCGAYELLFWDVSSGKQDPSGATNLRDAEWATWTAVLGWHVQGIWPPAADGTDINSVDRSHSGEVLVSADDFGLVKLFTFPNTAAGWDFKKFEGHSSHVTNVRFTFDDSFVVSSGGNDKAVMQWKTAHMDAALPPVEAAPADAAAGASMVDMFAAEDADGGDQFMAVKPWIGAIKAPTVTPVDDASAPAVSMKLDWVYGYQAQLTRNSVVYVQDPVAAATGKGDIAYCGAAVTIVYDNDKHSQRHHRNTPKTVGCTDDIIGNAVSCDGKYVAVGERGKRPLVVVIDTTTMATVAVLKGHRAGVPQLAFSNGGSLLATVGLDDAHTVIVYEWKTGTVAFTAKGDTNQIMGISWAPDDSYFVTVGVNHIFFWERKDRTYNKTRGILGDTSMMTTFLNCGFSDSGKAVIASAEGDLLRFSGDWTFKSSIKAHDGAINALWQGTGEIVTGGADGKIKFWNSKTFEVTKEYALAAGIRSVCTERGQPLLVGTIESEVWQIAADGKQKKLFESHYAAWHHMGELWGLSPHPSQARFATCGDDRTVRTWDVVGRKEINKAVFEGLMRAIAYSPDGKHLACAFGGRLGGKEDGLCGAYKILNAETLEVVAAGQDSDAWIQEIRYSPDGTTLAIGSHDDKVYLYDVAAGYKKKAICKGHSSFITHIDFTADSRFLHTNCGAYELLFWDANTGKQDPSGATNLRDAEWATWTAVLGWPVQGIWPPLADGTDINAVDRSHSGKLLASADDFGLVKLFNYPVVKPGAAAQVFTGHSSHVTNVRFLWDDKTVITAGGNDRCLFQWKL